MHLTTFHSHARIDAEQISMNVGGETRIAELVASLEAAALAIESELSYINTDLRHTETGLQRYGDVFIGPYRHLIHLRETKKQQFRGIISELEALRTQLQNSKQLLSVLNTAPIGSTAVGPKVTAARVRR